MINFMQRRKSIFLSIILVSVIVAFIGVGALNWGSIDLSGKSSNVAKVGNHHVSIQDYQNLYQQYFNYFNDLNNGELTQELANQMGLSKIVLDSLINEALLLNFADEMGIIVLEEEALKALSMVSDFQNKDGVFDKDIYYKLLRNVGIKSSDYERLLNKQLLLSKVMSIFDFPISEDEKKLMSTAFFLEDKISVATIKLDDGEIIVSDNETLAYWENNKNLFLTEKQYDFETIFVPVSKQKLDDSDVKVHYDEIKYLYKDENEKILDYETVKEDIEKKLKLKNTKSDSLKAFVSFKKGELLSQKNITVAETSSNYNATDFHNINIGDIVEIERDNGYELLKLIQVVHPQPKTYNEAKSQIISILTNQKKVQLLTQKAEARVSLFEGKDIGFISKTTNYIPDFTSQETQQFVSKVFDSKDKYGFEIFNDRAVLYKITEQKIPTQETIKTNNELLEQSVKKIRTDEITNNLIKQLKTRYKIEQYLNI